MDFAEQIRNYEHFMAIFNMTDREIFIYFTDGREERWDD